ncbi:MAG: hypothetical protein Aurels2KO_43310 [Aureliella sp.]
MDASFRGGNSRLLSRMLDRNTGPMAVLDSQGAIVFVNAMLCAAAQVDSTVLVGQKCSWDIPSDQSVAPALLSALAPPEAVLGGRLAARHLTTPPIYGTQISGELFIPIADTDGAVQLVVVLLGDWEQIRAMASGVDSQVAGGLARRDDEAVLASVRAAWPTLDGLHALVGDSSEIQSAMRRAVVAADSDCGVLLSGPSGVGKEDVARGLFMSRLKRLKVAKVDGVLYSIDCSVVAETQLEHMLDVFLGRISDDRPAASQNLVLCNAEGLSPSALQGIVDHCQTALQQFSLTLTCEATDDLAAEMAGLVQSLTQIEIVVPRLSARRQDIGPLLRKEFAHRFAKLDRPPPKIEPQAMQLLVGYSWPGNLVELREAADGMVENFVSRGEEQPAEEAHPEQIEVSDLPLAIRTYPGSVQTAAAGEAVEPIDLDEVLLGVEKEMIRRALALSPRNRAAAARMLGISRPRLLRRIDQLGLG